MHLPALEPPHLLECCHTQMQGPNSIAWCDALDKRPSFPQLPTTDSLEGVQQALASIHDRKHGSLLGLLQVGAAAPAHMPPSCRLSHPSEKHAC